MSKNVHWFPGHMKKAKNQIEDKIKLVDCVIEILDARIPISSRNQELYSLTKDKERVVVLSKADLADPIITKQWIIRFKDEGFAAIFADLNNPKDVLEIVAASEKCGSKKREKEIARGLKPQPIRAMIVGIPNVGKSTLINRLAKRRAAGVENKPGFTKGQQWIKVSNQFELLDTPGVLASNYQDETCAIRLALVGSMNENILPNDFLANYALDFLKANYPSYLLERYKLLDLTLDNHSLLEQIATNRGFLTKSGKDIARTEKTMLNEFKNGIIGRLSLDR